MLELLSDDRVSVVEGAIRVFEKLRADAVIIARLREITTNYHRVHVRNAAHRVLLRHWSRAASRIEKPEAELIRTKLSAHNIRHFYHHTSAANARAIEKMGEILNRAELQRRSLPVQFVSSNDSRQTDDRRGTAGYVHLCVHQDSPMFRRRKRDQAKLELVTLKVRAEVATWSSTLFSGANAAACWATIGPDWTDFESMGLDEAAGIGLDGKPNRQAEVLVHASVPISFVAEITPYAPT
ncbi:MAG: hypothetical protein C0518_09625 [Opitutus sp.]|nr:hypothetical protein [Opitutus sp.]